MPRRSRPIGIVVALTTLTTLTALAFGLSAARAERPPDAAKPAPSAVPAEATDCDRRLGEVATFIRLPAVAGPGECGGEDLLRLEAVTMPDRSRVLLKPAATLRCSMAEGVAQFVRHELGPSAAGLSAPLASLVTADSYDCRNRNRQQAARISEHARANALDISALQLRDRTRIALTDPRVSLSFREQVRDAACRWFATVLGPGSDAYHDEHIHLDRADRRHGYRLCQWQVRIPADSATVPLPPPKPVALRISKDERAAQRRK